MCVLFQVSVTCSPRNLLVCFHYVYKTCFLEVFVAFVSADCAAKVLYESTMYFRTKVLSYFRTKVRKYKCSTEIDTSI